MSINWWERPNTLRDDGNSVTLGFGLSGVTDKAMARPLALGYSSVLYRNLLRTACSVNQRGPDLYYVDVTWGTPDKREPTQDFWKWRFNTSGDTKHVTHGLAAATSFTPAGKATIDHKMAINVTDDGDVDGIDVPDRAFGWTEEHNLLLASFGFAYAQILGDNKGKYNSAPFRGLPAGTVQFVDADGGPSEQDPTFLNVTYQFKYSRNVTNLTVGDITGIEKKGWQYAWVRYEQAKDDAAKKLTQAARQVDVIDVLEEFDFAAFGIGTAAPTNFWLA